MAVERKPLYLPGARLPEVLGVMAVLGFIASVCFIEGLKSEAPWYKPVSQVIGSLWALGPPLWFLYEHFFYFPAHGNPDAGFASLKTAQELASKVWAAFIVILAALFTCAYPK